MARITSVEKFCTGARASETRVQTSTHQMYIPAVDFVTCVLCEEGVAGLRRHALVDVLARGRDAGAAGSPERSGRRGRRRGGQGRSAGVVGGEGLATGLARMDRVTFSTLKPTFR